MSPLGVTIRTLKPDSAAEGSTGGRWVHDGYRMSCLVALLFFLGCGPAEQELGDATEHFLAAQEALAKGDQQTALKELDASLSLQPDAWSYYQRAKVRADLGEDETALEDCAAGLQLDPKHVQLEWLQDELRKPPDRRFRGRNKEPPVTK